MRTLLPGLVLSLFLAASAWGLASALPGVGPIVVALVLGVMVGNGVSLAPAVAPGVKFADKRFLALAIALLGFGVDLAATIALGAVALPTLIVAVFVTVGLSVPIGRRLGVSPRLALLVGAGQGICGTAAVAASAPVIGAEEQEAGVAIGVVNLLGTLGLFVLPFVAMALGTEGAALLLGGTLQSVGHAVAAGFGLGEAVGQGTAVVKLGRVALLPLVLLVLAARTAGGGRGASLPPELVGFLAAVGVTALGIVPASVRAGIAEVADVLLLVAMAAIGLGIRLDALRTDGRAALALGGILFLGQIAFVGVVAFLAT